MAVDVGRLEFTPIQVGTMGTLDWSDLHPLLTELNRRYAFVRASVATVEPPAAGLTEIALSIAYDYAAGLGGAAGALFARKFLEDLMSDGSTKLREIMVDIFRRGKVSKSGSGRKFIPGLYEFGRVRFYFHGELSEEELQKRIRAAHRYVLTLPESAFEIGGGPMEWGLYWNEETEAWEGSIYGFTDYKPLPTRIWD